MADKINGMTLNPTNNGGYVGTVYFANKTDTYVFMKDAQVIKFIKQFLATVAEDRKEKA